MTNNFLEKVKAKPKDTIKAFLEEIKLHYERHTKSKHDQEKQWKELCEKNFSKSLDYRAFYFKQEENKNTKTKSFCSDIKKRFNKRNLDITPESIKKGGTLTSVYYNSYTMLSPETFHVNPIEGDEVAALSSEQIKKFASKLPQYQLRFDNKEAFEDAYRLVLHQILNGHASQTEKDKARNALDNLMENFIEFDVKALPGNEVEELSEEDVKVIMDENIVIKRIEHLDLEVSVVLEKLKTDTMRNNGDEKNQKIKTTRQSKTNRGGYNKKAEGSKIPPVLNRGLVHDTHNGLSIEIMKTENISLENSMFFPIRKNVFYGNANFYSFFRHFFCLYERLIKARELAGEDMELKVKSKSNIEAKHLEIWEEKKEELKKEIYRQVYLKGLYSVLSNTIDTARYEDFCRHCVGPKAYLLFAIDKLINSVRRFR